MKRERITLIENLRNSLPRTIRSPSPRNAHHRSINISIFSKVLSLFLIARAIVGANAKGNFMVFRYLTSVSHTGRVTILVNQACANF